MSTKLEIRLKVELFDKGFQLDNIENFAIDTTAFYDLSEKYITDLFDLENPNKTERVINKNIQGTLFDQLGEKQQIVLDEFTINFIKDDTLTKEQSLELYVPESLLKKLTETTLEIIPDFTLKLLSLPYGRMSFISNLKDVER